jgi:hypothetical protein
MQELRDSPVAGSDVAKKPQREPRREKRINDEILIECYDDHDVATAWFVYIEQQLQFPFTATCISKRVVSPLRVKDEVEVIEMAPESECGSEVFVMIRWERDGLAVPLEQLKPINATDKQTKVAVADWQYWRWMGHEN